MVAWISQICVQLVEQVHILLRYGHKVGIIQVQSGPPGRAIQNSIEFPRPNYQLMVETHYGSNVCNSRYILILTYPIFRSLPWRYWTHVSTYSALLLGWWTPNPEPMQDVATCWQYGCLTYALGMAAELLIMTPGVVCFNVIYHIHGPETSNWHQVNGKSGRECYPNALH